MRSTLILALLGLWTSHAFSAEGSPTVWAGAASSDDAYIHYLVALEGSEALPGAPAGYVIISGKRRCFIELTRSRDAEGRIVLSCLSGESDELAQALRAAPCSDYGSMPRPEELLLLLDPRSGTASVFERGELEHEASMTAE